MGDQELVLLSVRVPDTVPPRYEDRVVEVTATPGLYVSEHPAGREGWVLVARCGSWLANYVRWRSREAAHHVASVLGHHGIDWTLPTEAELIRIHPGFRDAHWAVVEQFDDLRHPTAQRSGVS